MIIAITLVAVMLLATVVLAAPDQLGRIAGPVLILLCTAVAAGLLRSGSPTTAGYVLGFGIWASVLLIAFYAQGVHTPMVMAFPLIVMSVGWIVSPKAALVMVAMTILGIVGLATAETAHILPAYQASSPAVYASEQIAFLILTGLLVISFTQLYQARLKELNDLTKRLTTRRNELESRTRELKQAQAVANVGSWVYNVRTDSINPSAQAAKILGFTSSKKLSHPQYLSTVVAEDMAGFVQAWQLALNGQDLDHEHRVQVNDAERWVRQIADIEFDADGVPISAVGTVQDITERKLAQLALSKSEARHRTLIEWSPDAVLVHREGVILYVNPAAVRLFRAPYAHALMSKNTNDLIHPDFRDEQVARMHSLYNHEKIPPSAEAKFMSLDGQALDVEVQGTAIDYDGEVAIHVVIRDITQRKKMERQVRRLAFYDTLTLLPNRRLLRDRLSQAIAVARRNDKFGAVMFLDLDNFKPLNDKFGHNLGDQLLVEVAQRLKACVREVDTVARFGGDEFITVIEDLSADREEAVLLAHTVASKISHRLAEPYTLENLNHNDQKEIVKHRCTASIGVVILSKQDDSPDDLVKWADAAMYLAKSQGRNQIQFYEAAAANNTQQDQFSGTRW
jgi:diguanylate cyclase (GGDEF)-like protein/PAS domain S-box-containing protein